MDDQFKMYAMSDGNPTGEPEDLDPDQMADFADEEEEIEGIGILTTSDDDDEVVAEEEVIAVVEETVVQPAARRPAKKKLAKKRSATKKAAKKTAVKKVASKKAARKVAKKAGVKKAVAKKAVKKAAKKAVKSPAKKAATKAVKKVAKKEEIDRIGNSNDSARREPGIKPGSLALERFRFTSRHRNIVRGGLFSRKSPPRPHGFCSEQIRKRCRASEEEPRSPLSRGSKDLSAIIRSCAERPQWRLRLDWRVRAGIRGRTRGCGQLRWRDNWRLRRSSLPPSGRR